MSRLIVTLKRISHELGRPERTVRRWYSEGKLPGAYKLGGETSPVTIRDSDLRKIKRGAR